MKNVDEEILKQKAKIGESVWERFSEETVIPDNGFVDRLVWTAGSRRAGRYSGYPDGGT